MLQSSWLWLWGHVGGYFCCGIAVTTTAQLWEHNPFTPPPPPKEKSWSFSLRISNHIWTISPLYSPIRYAFKGPNHKLSANTQFVCITHLPSRCDCNYLVPYQSVHINGKLRSWALIKSFFIAYSRRILVEVTWGGHNLHVFYVSSTTVTLTCWLSANSRAWLH